MTDDTPTAPDETPRATLAEDERAVAEVLLRHDGWESTPWIECLCGLKILTITEHAAHVAEHLAPLLAAARAAGVAQGRAEERAEIVRADHRVVHQAGLEIVCSCGEIRSIYGLTRSLASVFAQHVAEVRAARIAGGAEQREDT